MNRRLWVLLIAAAAGCKSSHNALVLPATIAEVWKLKESRTEPVASAPEVVRTVGARGWTAATYEGPGTAKIEIYELTSAAGGLEMVQRWRPQARTLVFYTDRYFVVV